MSTSYAQDSTSNWSPSLQLDFTSVPTQSISGTDTSYQNSLSVAPVFDYRSSGGFGISYSPVWVTGGSHPGIFMHQVTVGLEQYNNSKWILVADYIHYFFTGNPSIPSSPLTNEVVGEIATKQYGVNPQLSAGIGFGRVGSGSTPYDVEASAGISHTFKWKVSKGDITLIPALLADGGTSRYFSFLRLTKSISHAKSFARLLKNVRARNNKRNSGSTTTRNSQKFYLTDFEINSELTWETGSWSFRPSGSLFIPASAVSGGVSGYWEFNISYYF
ncbi:MAG: hypothetical protein KGM98_06685 [Bacteroidota bacterium]|nr:hypothetical protein [Bacteroidota bacterium]